MDKKNLECNISNLDERENYWIKQLDSIKNGYNMVYPTENPMNKKEIIDKYFRGDKNSSKRKEVNKKQSIARKKYWDKNPHKKEELSERMKSNNPMYNPLSRESMIKNKTGIKLGTRSNKTKLKMSESRKQLYKEHPELKLFGKNNPSSIHDNLWDTSAVRYSKSSMFKNNTKQNPRNAFKVKYAGKILKECGSFKEFISPIIINNLIKESIGDNRTY